MRRLRTQSGMALPLALVTMFIVALTVGAALSLSIGSLERSSVNKGTSRALAAADAGADVATWRMNKTLVAHPVAGLSGLATGVVRELGCVTVASGGSLGFTSLSGPGWCTATTWEDLDNDISRHERFQYYVSSGVNLTSGAAQVLERRVVAIGESGARRRRLLTVIQLRLDTDAVFKLFERSRSVECPSRGWSVSDPTAGCPQI